MARIFQKSPPVWKNSPLLRQSASWCLKIKPKINLPCSLKSFWRFLFWKTPSKIVNQHNISSIFSPEDRSLYREPRGPLDLRVRRRVGRLHPGEMLPQLGGPGPEGHRIRHPLPPYIRALLHANQVENIRRCEKDNRLLEEKKRNQEECVLEMIWSHQCTTCHKTNIPTTLQSMMNASQPRFWHCYENKLIKTIQTIPPQPVSSLWINAYPGLF